MFPRSLTARWSFGFLLAASLLLLIVFLDTGQIPPSSAAQSSLVVYNEQLAGGWSSCSWDSNVNFAATTAYSGSHAIGLTTIAPGGGLCLMNAAPFDASGYASLSFEAMSTDAAARYQVFLYDSGSQPTGYVWLVNAGGDPGPSAWKTYTISLADLHAGANLRGIGIQRIDGGTGAQLYVDDLAFLPLPAAMPTPTPPSTPTAPASLSVYGDALSSGWQSCSWDGQASFSATTQVYSGTRAIAFTPTATRGGLCLMAASAFDTTPYTSLHFAARSAVAGQRYQLYLYGGDGNPTGSYVPLASFGGDPSASSWSVYDVPLTLLGGAHTQIKGIGLQTLDAGVDQPVYIDDVSFALASPPPAPPLTQPIALGAYVPGAPGDAAALDAYSSLVGATPAIVMWYQGWGLLHRGEFDTAAMNVVTSRGATPMVTWMPWGDSQDVNQPAFAMKNIAAGWFDAYIHRWAKAAATWGQPMLLRFAHEMNGNWYPWSVGVDGNQSADYIAAWRHVHDIFVQEGATNVRWVWSPNVVGPGAGQFTSMYPGDAYVDWVALSGYNWGTTKPYQSWQALADVFGYSYDALAGMTTKPMMIAETASTESGGSKATWITNGLLTDLPTRLPRVRAVVWFDENKETDWRVNSSAGALDAFRQVASAALYKGKLP